MPAFAYHPRPDTFETFLDRTISVWTLQGGSACWPEFFTTHRERVHRRRELRPAVPRVRQEEKDLAGPSPCLVGVPSVPDATFNELFARIWRTLREPRSASHRTQPPDHCRVCGDFLYEGSASTAEALCQGCACWAVRMGA